MVAVMATTRQELHDAAIRGERQRKEWESIPESDRRTICATVEALVIGDRELTPGIEGCVKTGYKCWTVSEVPK